MLDLDTHAEFDLDEEYSNAIDPAMIAAGAQGLGSIAGAFKPSEAKQNIKATCGRKPMLAWGAKGKANKAKYEACIARASAPAPSYSAPASSYMPNMGRPRGGGGGGGKGGSNTPLIIGGVVLGVGVLAMTLILVLKK